MKQTIYFSLFDRSSREAFTFFLCDLPSWKSLKLAGTCNTCHELLRLLSYLSMQHIISVYWYSKFSLSFYKNIHRITKTKLPNFAPHKAYKLFCLFMFSLCNMIFLVLIYLNNLRHAIASSKWSISWWFSGNYQLLMTTMAGVYLIIINWDIFK